MNNIHNNKWFTSAWVACLVIVSSFGNLVPGAYAAPISATGFTKLEWGSYSGTTEWFMLNKGGMAHSTGAISFSLDSTFEKDNYYEIDWDTGAASIKLHLLVNAPFLVDYGMAPVHIVIHESGTVGAAPLIEPGVTTVADLFPASVFMAGGGTVMVGPFAGLSITNDTIWNVIAVNNNAPVDVTAGGEINVPVATSITLGSQHIGNITQPGEASQTTQGSGAGQLYQVFEPVSFYLLLIGLAGMGLIRRNARHPFSCQTCFP